MAKLIILLITPLLLSSAIGWTHLDSVAKLQATTGANVGVAEVQLVVDWAEIADCQVTFAVVVTIDPEDELPDQLLRAVQVLEIVCEAQ